MTNGVGTGEGSPLGIMDAPKDTIQSQKPVTSLEAKLGPLVTIARPNFSGVKGRYSNRKTKCHIW